MSNHESSFMDLFEGVLSKSERTRIEIAQAAIKSYATLGVEQTNFDRVAKACGVTRPLVQHYFGTREALFAFAVKYLRSHAVSFARTRSRASARAKTSDAELREFLETCLDWAESYPEHAKVWILFQYYASIEAEFRELNSEIVNSLHQYLVSLLVKSSRGNDRDFASLVTAARMILHLLSGMLMSQVTELHPIPAREFRKEVIRRCLELV